MRRGGRVRFSVYARFLSFCAGIAIASCIEYGVPIEIEYWDTGRSPLSHMVDVTNGFGLKVLAEHNFLNDNNIAFSPYGLMGIMVALFEGVDGDSSYQIQRAMQLPWNRNVMRIGFRDIHRTLKTYFVPEEGFLAGLALNNENVTFNENYKNVLRFYGFDLESEQTTTTSPVLVNSTSTSVTTTDTLEIKIPTTFMTTMNVENVSTTAKEESTTNPSVTTNMQESTMTQSSTTAPTSEPTTTVLSLTTNVMQESTMLSSTTISPTNEPGTTITSVTTNLMQESTTTPSTTISPTNEPSTTTPSVTTDVMQESTMAPTTTITPTNEPGTTIPSTTTDVMQESTMTTSSTVTLTNDPSSTIQTTSALSNLLETTETATPVSAEATMASSTVIVTSTTSEPLPTTVTTTLNTDVEFLTDITLTQGSPTSTSSMTTEPSTITTSMQGSVAITIVTTSTGTTGSVENTITSTMTSQPSTESLTTLTPTSENPQSTDSSTLTSENTTDNTESVPNQATAAINESTLETLTRRKKSIVDFIFTNPPYIEDYSVFRSYDIGPDLPNTPVGYEFSVNGIKNIQVTYMNYDTVLEHAYLPHLEASALKLPLDSDRYYLLVVLPNRRRAGELERLLARMARESDLSDVYAAMRPRRVRALVPGFVVKGHVTLTTDLQKVGIREVFEPRQSDFTPMTCQVGVYVRSIEQAVSVAIRKYQPDTKMNRYVKNWRRVYFSATYPFLYFVMDSSIHVALMAGKMVDPLNTRIL